MLHLEIEVQSLQFFIEKYSEQCKIVIHDANESKILTSKILSQCSSVQDINEVVEFDFYYTENRYLKIMVQDCKVCYGEAILNLGFYIENHLPLVIDKIPIHNRQDQEAYIQVGLAWNQSNQSEYKRVGNNRCKINQEIKKSEEWLRQKRECQHSPVQERGEILNHNREETLKKYSEQPSNFENHLKYSEVDKLNEPEVNTKRQQTVRVQKVSLLQQKSKEEKSDFDGPVALRENKFVVPGKRRTKNVQNHEEIMRGSTKPKANPKKLDQFDNFNSRPTQNEQALLLSCRQLEKGEYDENSLQIQNQMLQYQNKLMKQQNEKLLEQIKKSEAAFNLLSETYSALQSDYKKMQIQSFNSNFSNSFINELYNLPDKNSKEIQQIKKESEILKKENEILLKENDILKDEKDTQQQKYIQEISKLKEELTKIKNTIVELQKEKISLQNYVESRKDSQNNKEYCICLQKEELRANRDKFQYSTNICVETIYQVNDEKGRTKCSKNQIDNLLKNEGKFNQLSRSELQKLVYEYSNELQISQKENQQLILNSKKDQIRLESNQKELEITKRIVKLSDQRCSSLEHQIVQLEKAVLNGKQNIADMINAVMECGGQKLYDQVERCLAFRRSLKLE
ncbi:unnamed protein product (macronuclear) [Paramecium tetraurelia]|uniref:C2 domain-containing protein n=1 Tax=Paramecium tetraurelia TaxID=5888 RepID=A0DHM7_PARTE|nr:uncharacterized protein GSPATT00016931001 [Paramecium tetraurelia]CAK82544.1 unnamed protein product [Paramecium tetraurelia]|eukprot:XP_001449941.1 hypothetical protein (macronuclear) [Paramecium tetraurelia strain d4-2]